MVGRGHGRIFIPVDIMVSALDADVVELEVLMTALTRNDDKDFYSEIWQ
jgi:hypothetical protein